MFTNDLSYKVIKKVIDKTIYIVNETIDNIRLIYVSIKINCIKKRQTLQNNTKHFTKSLKEHINKLFKIIKLHK